MKIIKTIVPLIVIAAVLGVFIVASGETAAAEKPTIAEEEPAEPIEISHEEAAAMMDLEEDAYYLTAEERQLVIAIVAAEARGETLEGMMGVAQSIRDRAVTRQQTVTEVCLAPWQYADPYYGEVSTMDRIEDAVFFVFDKGHSPLEVPTTHFYAHDEIEAPEWAYKKVCRGVIGGHTFFG